MRRLALPLLLTLLVLPLAAGIASGQQVGDSAVHVFPIDEPEEVRLGERIEYTFAVFNADPAETYLIQAVVLGTELGFAARFEPDHLFLAPRGSDRFILTLDAPVAGRAGVALFPLEFRAVNLATEETHVLALTAEASLLGVRPEEDPVGKILGLWENPLPPPLDDRVGAFAVTVAIWTLVALAVVFVVGPLTRVVVERAQSEIVALIVRILRGPVFVLILAFGAVTSVEILGVSPQLNLLLRRLYALVFILVATWIAYRVWRDVLIYYAQKLTEREEKDVGTRLLPALDKLGGLVIVVMGLLIAFQSLGVDVTLLLAGMGVAGLVIAFAAQDTLSNFFAGLHIMLDKPFRVGDLIEVEPGVICEVMDIGLRSTKLYWGREHDVLIFPNKEMANKKIVNYFRPDYRFKTNVKVGVAYGTDLDHVERVLKEVAASHPDVISGEGFEPLFRVAEFADNAIVCLIIVWVKDARLQWGVRGDLTKWIDKRFKEEGIVIAFPQRDVWVREWPGKKAPWEGGPS